MNCNLDYYLELNILGVACFMYIIYQNKTIAIIMFIANLIKLYLLEIWLHYIEGKLY